MTAGTAIREHTHYGVVRDARLQPRRLVCLLCKLRPGLSIAGQGSRLRRERFSAAGSGALERLAQHIARVHAGKFNGWDGPAKEALEDFSS